MYGRAQKFLQGKQRRHFSHPFQQGRPRAGALSPCTFVRGATGDEVLFNKSIIGNFMVY